MEMSNNHTLSVCDEDWKYISPSDGPALIPWGPKIETGYRPYPQLFSRSADPGETTNLAPDYPEITEHFRQLLP